MSIIKTTKKIFKKFNNNFVRGRDNFNEKHFKKYKMDKINVNNREVLTIYNEPSNINIIFFHGGAYVDEGLIPHRMFVKRIINNFKVKMTYIDYPLAPESNYKDTHEMILKSYQAILEKYPNDKFYLIGDSAGGGLALAFLQELNELKITKPSKTALLSPWVDVSMTNPNIKDYEKIDPILLVSNLVEEGLLYAKGTSLKNYLVSPKYGDMNNLGKIMIISGSHELLLPDIKECHELINQGKNSSSILIVEEGMFHDFALAPLAKSKESLNKIMNFLLEEEK